MIGDHDIVGRSRNTVLGGQSIPNFDYAMAPGVLDTFNKELADVAEIFIDTITTHNEEMLQHIWHVITFNTWHLDQEEVFVEHCCSLGDRCEDFARDVWNKAVERTERETYQSMEALIHNLNTLHCIPASQRLWVFDRQRQTLDLMTVAGLCAVFEEGRFLAISMNWKTNKAEFKPITRVWNVGDNRRLVTLTNKCGQKITTTDNHRILTYDDTVVVNKFPEAVDNTISPRGIKLPPASSKTEYIGDLGEVYANSPYQKDTIEFSTALAELMGYYVADGSVCGGVNSSGLSFTTMDKVAPERLSKLMAESFGQEFTYTDIMHTNKAGESVHKDRRFNVGVRLGRAFKKLCGGTATEKHIPMQIFLGPDEWKLAFLNAYLSCDGRSTTKYIEAGSVSKTLIRQIGLLIMSMGEMPVYNEHTKRKSGYGMDSYNTMYMVSLGNMAAKRIGLNVYGETSFEIPRYDLSPMVGLFKNKYKLTWQDVPRRHKLDIRYSEVEDICQRKGISMEDDPAFGMLQTFKINVKSAEISNSGAECVYDISVEDNENFLTEDGVYIHNSRAGAQVPFSALNYGTDTSPEGRMVIEQLLLATEAGLGDGETPIFPVQIFKLRKGVNYDKYDDNVDLFHLACRVSAKRLFPNFESLDAPFNAMYYKEGDYNTEVATMGCRTRVMGNVCGDSTTCGRGNLSFTTINLPRLAIESKGSIPEFFARLEEVMDLCVRQLLHRFEIQSKRTPLNLPFLMGQGIWRGGDKLKLTESVREVLKQGTLSIGFVGLAECLIALIGKHQGESDDAQELGLKIVKAMRDRMDRETEERHMNFTLIATPAESTASRLMRLDKKEFGVIPGVTEREYYTNSFHVPVWYNTSLFHKVDIEAPYHALTNAGHITYVEFDGDTAKNVEAFEQAVRYMHDKDCGYFSVNHPVDRDPVCGYVGVIGDVCPRCGRRDGEAISQEKLEEIQRKYGATIGQQQLCGCCCR